MHPLSYQIPSWTGHPSGTENTSESAPFPERAVDESNEWKSSDHSKSRRIVALSTERPPTFSLSLGVLARGRFVLASKDGMGTMIWGEQKVNN